jgi:hypothetical protein
MLTTEQSLPAAADMRLDPCAIHEAFIGKLSNKRRAHVHYS